MNWLSFLPFGLRRPSLLLTAVAGACCLSAQSWRSADAVPFFRGTAIHGLVRTQLIQNSGCIANLRQLETASASFAADHQDRLPASWQDLRGYLANPRAFYCPADAARPSQDDWTRVDFSSVSYELLVPGTLWSTSASSAVIRCSVHGNTVRGDGVVREARPYSPASFPVPEAGALRFPLTALDTAREAAVSIACLNKLKIIGLAARTYAADNGDRLPARLRDLGAELRTTDTLYCPANPFATVALDFDSIVGSNLDYVLEFPGGQADVPARLASCRIHAHWVMTDGVVNAGTNRSPPRLIGGHPLDWTVEPGRPVALSVSSPDPALGPLRYQWRRLQPFDATGQPFTNTVAIPDATNRTLLIPSAQPQHEGYYDVIVYDAQGGYQLSQPACVRVEPLANLTSYPAWERIACTANLAQLSLAARLAATANNDRLPQSLGELGAYLGWPLALYCPADSSRTPPDSWGGVDYADTSYALTAGLSVADATEVLAACWVHGYRVTVEGTLLLTTEALTPARLEVSRPGAAGALTGRLHGTAGALCVVESSSDLTRWTPVLTNRLWEGTLVLTNLWVLGESRQIYRALLR